MRFSSTKRKTN